MGQIDMDLDRINLALICMSARFSNRVIKYADRFGSGGRSDSADCAKTVCRMVLKQIVDSDLD
jgi:hypothetical protein